MKKFLFLLLSSNLIVIYAQGKASIDEVLQKYSISSKRLLRVEYDVVRKDTFGPGSSWHMKGSALIERDDKEKEFGFWFFGDNFTRASGTLYDGQHVFRIDQRKKRYRMETDPVSHGILGSPGGQMIVKELFSPDTGYVNVSIVSETPRFITIEYQFADDSAYDIMDRHKLVELYRNTFLPHQVISSHSARGDHQVIQSIVTHLRINGAVTNSIARVKTGLFAYRIQKEQAPKKTPSLIGSKASPFKLEDLFAKDTYRGLPENALTLLDFWQPWCSPCVGSLLEVEKISVKYANRLNVLGIVTDNPESARKLIGQKRLTYLNLLGDKKVIADFHVEGWPKYVLIDKNGVIRNEYYGFNSNIEADITKLLEH